MRIAEACDREQAQTLGSNTSEPDDEAEPVKISVDRRSIFKRTGMALLASGALATLATPSRASGVERNGDAITGLWLGVISVQDNSFPPFNAFEIYDGATWTSSGQTD